MPCEARDCGFGARVLRLRFCFALRSKILAQDDGGGIMQASGLVQVASRYSVDESVERLKSLLEQKGLQIFAVIDHSGEAAKVGMKMRPTKVVLFGSPKGGTPL